MLMKFAPDSFANAFANMVLPHPVKTNVGPGVRKVVNPTGVSSIYLVDRTEGHPLAPQADQRQN